jgi:hypothetical protein|nr:hypothetical protein [Stenotrophomonas pavanii]
MRGLFPKKKSRLSPQGNAIAAAHVLLDSAEGDWTRSPQAGACARKCA